MTDAAPKSDGLVSASATAFDAAANALCAPPGPADPAAALSTAVTAIAGAGRLPTRERDRRIRLLVGRLSPIITDMTGFLTGVRTIAPRALNAVRAALPPEFRPMALAAQVATTVPALRQENVVEPTPPWDSSVPASGALFGVALVGTESEHSKNVALLRDSDLKPLRISTIAELQDLGSSGLCGFVIAPSVWSGLGEDGQRAALRAAAELSTFLFSRVAIDGLSPAVAGSAVSIAADTRRGPLDASRFCHGRDCDLSPADVQTLLGRAALLTAAEGAGFYPLGADEREVRLLRLIAADRHRPSDPVAVSRLGARELPGGRSGARLYLLQPHAGGPFVVKLGTIEALSDELRRHHQWIEAWEPILTNPSLHLHLGRAAISYRLQAAADVSSQPAPTLDDAIERLRAEEWDTRRDPAPFASDLESAVSRAADRLMELNRTTVTPLIDQAEPWLHWPLRDLGARGIVAQLSDGDGQPIDLLAITQAAVARLRPLARRAVVHGDIHGRNILLIDRLPAFIDYASSGPGHPLEDLARLDATVRSAAFRALLGERDLHSLFSSIYINGDSADTVLAAYPGVSASAACRLAIRCATKIRTCALEVASVHGGGVADYLAMVTVVSGYILAHRGPASLVERSLLAALAATVRSPSGSAC